MNIYRGRPAHLAASDGDDGSPAPPQSQEVAELQSGLDDEPIVIVQLSNRVQDGTRCRTGSLDMCIQGKCQVRFSETCTVYIFEYILLKACYILKI